MNITGVSKFVSGYCQRSPASARYFMGIATPRAPSRFCRSTSLWALAVRSKNAFFQVLGSPCARLLTARILVRARGYGQYNTAHNVGGVHLTMRQVASCITAGATMIAGRRRDRRGFFSAGAADRLQALGLPVVGTATRRWRLLTNGVAGRADAQRDPAPSMCVTRTISGCFAFAGKGLRGPGGNWATTS